LPNKHATDIAVGYDEIAHCNRCGFCQVACPVFRATGQEAGVARGRLAMLRAIIEGRLGWSDEIEGPLYDCLLCGACTANCFPAIPTVDLLVNARAAYLSRVGRKSVHRLLFDHLLPYPRRLRWAARTLALGKNSGMADMAQALGLLRVFGRNLIQANDLIAEMPVRALRQRYKPGRYKGDGPGPDVGYFVGCGIDCMQAQAGRATLTLLRRMSCSVTVLDNACCGMPAWSYGDLAVARKLAAKNMTDLLSADVHWIVTDCASCAAFLKQYPNLFDPADPRRQKAQTAAAKVRDMVECLAYGGLASDRGNKKVKVTYHDPCHAVRGQGIRHAPRVFLQGLSQVDYVELPEADWCCGGAGAYALENVDLANRVLDRKIENVRQTGADLLVTACPACMIQLAYGIRKHRLDVAVRHISQMADTP
jgi:glycolate oxidase iron-sulfur subunit